jgi:hypothetical protein
VRLTGSAFAESLQVKFGDALATFVRVHGDAGTSFADVRTPARSEGFVDVEIANLDADGAPIPGEVALLPGAYRYLRPRTAHEADLTRLVRRLLQELKRQIAANVSASVSVDYDDTPGDGLNLIAMASLPAIVLSGPVMRPNRFYSTNVPHEGAVTTPSGPELVRHKPPYTVDLVFTLTVSAARTAELLNLMAAVATFLNRNRSIELARDTEDPALGTVRWELDPDGEFRTDLAGPGNVRAFTCGLLIRGFDVDEGLPLDRGKAVDETEVEVVRTGGGEC